MSKIHNAGQPLGMPSSKGSSPAGFETVTSTIQPNYFKISPENSLSKIKIINDYYNNNKNKKYEVRNHVSDNGDSISAVPIKELPGGQIYVSENKIRDIVKEELDRRLGPSLNKEDVPE